MPAPPAKVLVIGIDAANPELVQRWARDGTLPNIRSLMSRGLDGTIRGVEGFFIGSTWPSFYTGATPARHGFHYQVQLKPGSYSFYRPAASGMVRVAPFWRHLSDAGHRVALLDVPLSPLDLSLNGMQVLEWATHDTIYGFRTTPSSMARTMRSSFGRYPLASCDAIRHGADDYRSLTDSLVAGVRAKTRLTKHFLGHGGWDFFMQVFAESHCIGHQCWHLHDNTHPAHDPAVVAAVGDPLRKVYIAIDAAVGELMDMIGDALVMLVVPHGMSYWYGAQFLLKPILFRLGVACPAPSPSHSRTGVARRMWRQLPKAVRERATPVYERLREKLGGAEGFPPIDVDTGKSRCFPQNNGLAIGGIRLNLAHREPTGVLQPGAEADAFCEDLTQDLLSIVQEDRGEPLVKRVLRTSQLYAGDCLDYLPDLLVEWSDAVPTGSAAVGNGEAAIIRARSPKIGVIEGVNHYARTGEHRQRGLFIAAGPNLKRGTLQREISILDLAPTFASLFSVHLPDCDGTPVHELLGRAPRAH